MNPPSDPRIDAAGVPAVPCCTGADLAALADLPLYEPFAALLRGWPAGAAPTLGEIERRLGAEGASGRTNLAGQPIRFVHPDGEAVSYEQRIHDRGEVVTRPGNWHDFFNALVWARFPRAKAALNALHVEASAGAQPGARGGLRDAATQFDESGLVVLASDPALLELLASRRWVELFWDRRAEVASGMRCLVFGHGLLDALRAPFAGLCGRAVLLAADRAVVAADVDAQAEFADGALAARCRDGWYARAKQLTPLPVLGIPGVSAASECRAYYEDTRQFRPLRWP